MGVRKQGNGWAVIKPDGTVDVVLSDEGVARRLAAACSGGAEPMAYNPRRARNNTARKGINKAVRRDREMAKAEEAYQRVAAYGSLSALARAREIEEAAMKRRLDQIRAARKRADVTWRREINKPALELFERETGRPLYATYHPDWETFKAIEARVEASKPHLWRQFLAQYRESLGLWPVLDNGRRR